MRRRSKNCFAFQAPPGNARTLRRAGVDIVNHANNHAFDYGAVGWRSTRDALGRAKVGATGAPGEIVTLKRARGRVRRLLDLQVEQRRWATTPGSRALSSRRRAGPTSSSPSSRRRRGRGQDARPARPREAFGEYRGDSRRFARVAIDAGADLVLGSGPHVLRGLELYKGRLIAYSLGNLAGYKNFSTAGRSGLSALLTVAVAPDGRFFAGRIDSLRAQRRRRSRARTLPRRGKSCAPSAATTSPRVA